MFCAVQENEAFLGSDYTYEKGDDQLDDFEKNMLYKLFYALW